MNDHMYSLVAQDLAVRYDATLVFRHVDVAIPQGKITTLIGPNGSGKSTLLKSLVRLQPFFEGTVCLDGRDITTMTARDVARKLALLPQSRTVPQGIRVRELCGYGRYPHRQAFARMGPEDREAVAWALEVTGMEAFADREVDTLSGGQRQHAWIAMALAQKTSILVLDEPTTYLDIAHQLDILKLLQELNRQQGVTVLMVLHDINHALMFSDYIIALKSGCIAYQGSPRHVVTPQMLHDVFGVNSAVIEHPVLHIPVCLPY